MTGIFSIDSIHSRSVVGRSTGGLRVLYVLTSSDRPDLCRTAKHGTAHFLHDHLDWRGIASFAVLFVPVWWLWIDFSYKQFILVTLALDQTRMGMFTLCARAIVQSAN